MSDDHSDAPPTQTDETEAEAETETEALAPALPLRQNNQFTRPTDLASRPGFRSPANSKTKAQKSSRKKH